MISPSEREFGEQQTSNQHLPKLMKKTLIALVAASVALFGVAQAEYAKKSKDIVGVAVEAGQFKTLVAAVQAAGLVETLQGKGPFTVFAPTDDAFAKLPKGTVEELLKPENKAKLQAVLKYHVVAGKVMAADVKAGKVTTVQGQAFEVKIKDGKVHIDNATVVKTDIAASNGVIHVIDTVILPAS
jgi:uncharacterized surface protein with fasciclin (FAS1) repeats